MIDKLPATLHTATCMLRVEAAAGSASLSAEQGCTAERNSLGLGGLAAGGRGEGGPAGRDRKTQSQSKEADL